MAPTTSLDLCRRPTTSSNQSLLCSVPRGSRAARPRRRPNQQRPQPASSRDPRSRACPAPRRGAPRALDPARRRLSASSPRPRCLVVAPADSGKPPTTRTCRRCPLFLALVLAPSRGRPPRLLTPPSRSSTSSAPPQADRTSGNRLDAVQAPPSATSTSRAAGPAVPAAALLRSSLSLSDPASPYAPASSLPPGRRSAAGDQAAGAPSPYATPSPRQVPQLRRPPTRFLCFERDDQCRPLIDLSSASMDECPTRALLCLAKSPAPSRPASFLGLAHG